MTKRAVSLLLIVLMLIQTSACSEKAQNDAEESSAEIETVADISSESETLITEETEESETLDVPFTDYDGYVFNALTGIIDSVNWREITVDELTGEPINDAFYNRNLWVEDKLNIKITSDVNSSSSDNRDAFKNSVIAQDGAYDCAFMPFGSASSTVTGGYCIDLNTVPNINLDKSWWNSDSRDQLKIYGKNYLIASDIGINDKDVMWVLYFDKQYINDLQLDNPYELLAEGKWTFDVFYDMIKQGLGDLDGNGKLNLKDRFGLLTHSENYAGMWMSAGESLITLDENNVPQITWGSERFSNVWDKITQIMGDRAVYSNNVSFISTGLRDGQALFATEVVAFIRSYRSNDREFGILPMPKYDENQDRYYTYVAVNSDLMVVNPSVADLGCTGEILEVLAAKGKEMILPDYYDVSLKSKGARDEESAASLDIIFSNRMYDLGVVFGWGGVADSLKSPNVQLSSAYEKSEKLTRKTMEKALANMMDN